MLQRLSALIMAPLVLLHLVVVIWVSRGELSAADIIDRFQSNWLWPLLYGLFVVAAAIHAPIGFRNILIEWWPGRGPISNFLAGLLFVVLLGMGARMLVALSS